MLETLNRDFGVDPAICFVNGNGNQIKMVLAHRSGASAELYLQGAHVSSWKTAQQEELLFMSSKSAFAPGKAIRGGIPLIFPQFGGGDLPAHGFARNEMWSVKKAAVASNGDVTTILGLAANDATKKVWPHHFELELTVCLNDKLTLTLSCRNLDQHEFDFQTAFHTYFQLGNITQARVTGLNGLTFIDKVKGGVKETEKRSEVGIDQETDRVYLNAPNELTLTDNSSRRAITLTKKEMRDAVVWNPWAERCKNMSDLAPGDYEHFICVESGAIGEKIKLAAGKTYLCTQVLTCTKA